MSLCRDMMPPWEMKAEIDRLTARVAELEGALEAVNRLADGAAVASCICGIKSPDVTFHDPGCRYVLLQYIISHCENARAALSPSQPAPEKGEGRRVMADITIPPKALKAARAAFYSNAGGTVEAACLAMLKHWPRQTYTPPEMLYGCCQRAYFILPLDEPSDA